MNFTQSNLFILFSTLSPGELKELDKAVNSPFFNYRPQEVLLFNYLLKTNKTKTPVTAEDAYKQVFAGEKTNWARLRHVMTYLTRIIHRFLAIQAMEANQGQRLLLLAETLRKRAQPKLFLQTYTQAEQQLLHNTPISPSLYYYQLQLHTEYYSYSITNRRQQNNALEHLSNDLDLFYVTQKLKQACNILSYKNIFKTSHRAELLDETLALMERKKMLGNPLVNVLYCNYLCLSQPDNETYFEQLKQLLLTQSHTIDVRELRDAFTLAINYCIKRLNTGGQKYYRHVFDIYKTGLAQHVFEDNGRLSPFTYKNITAIALGLKEYKWAGNFIEQYKPLLSMEVRHGFYTFCLARYHFAQGNYVQAGNLLREVEIKEQFTDLDARVLLVKTYYEQDEDSLLDYALGNLKQQLKRKKLQTYHQEVYQNFAKMTGKLLHLRPYDKKAREMFKQQVTTLKSLAEREWLLQKVK